MQEMKRNGEQENGEIARAFVFNVDDGEVDGNENGDNDDVDNDDYVDGVGDDNDDDDDGERNGWVARRSCTGTQQVSANQGT